MPRYTRTWRLRKRENSAREQREVFYRLLEHLLHGAWAEMLLGSNAAALTPETIAADQQEMWVAYERQQASKKRYARREQRRQHTAATPTAIQITSAFPTPTQIGV